MARMGKTAATVASRTIAVSGYYGFDNSGDEAVLQSILLALEEQGRENGIRFDPIVLSIDPDKTSRVYGVKSAHRMKLAAVLGALRTADGLISGGGSLLQDETGVKTIPYYLAILNIAQWLGKPTFVYSQGIGPVHRRWFYPLIRGTFRKCEYISVRDPESADLLQRMGLPRECIDIVPDPVMGLPLKPDAVVSESDTGTGEPVIGVSVRFWNQDRSELAALARALQNLLVQRPARIRFLPFHLPADEAASEHVISLLDEPYRRYVSIAKDAAHPQDMLAEVGRCQLLIGMRLHSLIYAASQCVPIIGISYDPKIDQFLNRLDMKAAASTSRFDPALFANHALDVLEQSERWKREKAPAIERLKSDAQRPAKQIAQFFKG
jgi:polysaccharide pyruvyl transferase CsaB